MGRRNGRTHNPVVRRRGKIKTFIPKTERTKDRHGEEGMMDYLNKLQGGASKAASNIMNMPGFNLGKIYTHEPVEECWETEIKVLKSCGSAPERINVTIGALAMTKINALMKNYPKMEWLAYLVGDGQNVTDIVIPRQKVSVVRVDVAPEGVSVPTIGVIHSHHDMGNGFSHTDDEYINQNHPMSLCISHGGIQGVVRVQTACGSYVLVKANVVQTVEGFDHDGFIKDAEKLISQPKYTYNAPVYGAPGARGGNVHNIHNLGLEDTDDEVFGLGIEDMSDTFIKDLEEFPESFQVIDLAGYKEILMEVTRVDRNYDVFASMYNNILDNNSFDDTNEQFLCIPVELLDMIDSEFETLSANDRNHLGTLLLAVSEAVDGYIDEQTGNTDITRTGTEGELWGVDVDKDTQSDNLWSTEGGVSER